MIKLLVRVLKLRDVGAVKDIIVSFFSERQYKEVEIGVDDIVAIYEDDTTEMDEINAVSELIGNFVNICGDKEEGSLEFCVDAREELKVVLQNIEESAKKMRMVADYKEGKERNYRRIRHGARERNILLDVIRLGLDELEVVIKERSFYEGGY